MANFPCPNTIICPCADGNPLSNFSSEAPDPFVYEGFRFPIWNPNNPIGGGRPPAPPIYYAADCGGFCTSTISQEDADLCAARQAYICSHTPPGGGPPPLFFNQPQTCILPCGNGSFFIWQVPGGSFVNVSQAVANEQAQAYACLQAARHAFCLNDIPNEAETGVEYDATIFVNGAARTPVHFIITAGSLPPGLHLTPEGPLSTFLHGKPTSPGTYNFQIEAIDAIGVAVTKNYQITVTSSCTDFWNALAPTWGFTTLFAASSASRVGNVINLLAYVRQALDASAVADAQALLPSPTTGPFQCQISIVPTALTNLLNNPALQILVQDSVTAAVYLTATYFPLLVPTVLTFNLPAGAKPVVDFQASVVNAGNGFDSALGYSITLG